MSTEQTDQVPPSQQPQSEWGATPPPPAAPRQKWNMKRTVIAVVVAVGIAGAGGVAIYAASGSVTTDQQGRGGPGGGGGPMIVGGPQGGFDETQHGEFQVGEVTEVSDTSITAKSEDGYTQTYVVDSDTVIEGVEKGDSVTIVATVSGDTSTAASVMERGAGMQPRRGTNGEGSPKDNSNGGN